MTDRLYHTDATLVEFTATVTDVTDGGCAVVLDRTAFYPTSGGQPHDVGTLAGVAVVDVEDADDRIVHRLAAPVAATRGDSVAGHVDWARRFDHMQQHSAQHLLSALFASHLGWATVSVHFGADSSTIDLATPAITPAQALELEALANAAVVAAHPVTIAFEEATEATGLRRPSRREGLLRIVTIAGIDRSACGGTHVAHTGQLGAVLLRRTEHTKGMTRVEFVAGTRAVACARADHDLLQRLARPLSVPPGDLPAVLEAQGGQLKALEREVHRLRTALARHEAEARWEATPPGADGLRRIRLHQPEGPVRDLEPLALALAARGGCCVVATADAPATVLLATSSDSGIHAGQVLREALSAVGGRGGGSATLAQGSVPSVEALTLVTERLGSDGAP